MIYNSSSSKLALGREHSSASISAPFKRRGTSSLRSILSGRTISLKTFKGLLLASLLPVSMANAVISVFIQDAPIELDGEDTSTIYTGGRDTMLEAGANADVNYGDLDQLSVDTSTRRDAVIAFDDIFGTGEGQIGLSDTINWGTLALYTLDASIGDFGIYKLTTDWDESTATYNNFGNSADDGVNVGDAEGLPFTPLDFVSGPEQSTGVFFDISSALLDWQLDPDANYGVVILTTSDDGWDFGSFERTGFGPVLIADYTPVPEPQTFGLLMGIVCLLFSTSRVRARN
ncbi:MAG: DNRLRE domain-containing protein [Opitutaceae bacterium]